MLFRPLLARVGPKLRLLVSGGAALEEHLVWRLEGLGWTVRNGYGLAETASTFTGNLPGRERIGSEGQPSQGGELRIAAPGAAGVGEIQLRGPTVVSGHRANQIGRASCRERVGKDVQMSVVAVSLKNNQAHSPIHKNAAE